MKRDKTTAGHESAGHNSRVHNNRGQVSKGQVRNSAARDSKGPAPKRIEMRKGAARSKRPTRAQLSPEYQKSSDEFLRVGSEPRQVTILYNRDEVGADGKRCEYFRDDSFVAVESKALSAIGHDVAAFGVSFKNYQEIRTIKSDFVFNICDGTGLDGDPGVEVLVELERRVIPYSGVGSAPTELTNDKFQMKAALAAQGVPVPAGTVMAHPDDLLPPGLKYPLFVKPRFGWGSQGVDEYSLVHNEEELSRAVERIVGLTGVDASVEEYIDGREITVGIIGARDRVVVMPPLEIRFGDAYAGKPKVRMYETKQDEESPLYWGFHTMCPAPVGKEILSRIEKVALAAYRVVGADGFGRVDIRLSPDGIPYVLEVNANCSLEYSDNEHDSGVFPLIARALGWNFGETLARILGAGLLRPLRSYRLPKIGMRSEEGLVRTAATMPIPKGSLLAPIGAFTRARRGDKALSSASGGKIRPAPHVRFLGSSEEPNVTLYRSRGALWLAAARSIRTGETLTFDWSQKIEDKPGVLPVVLSPVSPSAAPLQQPRSRERARRR